MNRQNELVVVLGKKGGGKTSIVSNLTASVNRLSVFDYNREYERGLIVKGPLELVQAYRIHAPHIFRIIYRPDDSQSIEEHYNDFYASAYAVPNQTIVAEEIDSAATSIRMPEGLKKIVNYGRHKGISLIGISRRPARVPRDLTSNADRIYVAGPMNEPRDVKYLAEFMGDNAAQVLESLSIEQGKGSEYLEWDLTGTKRGRIDFVTKQMSAL